MPIKSTKPRAGRFNASPEPQVTQDQFKRGGQQLNRMLPKARTQVMKINAELLALTQPYPFAASLRGGNQFQMQQNAAIRKENIGAPPPRGFGSRNGLARQLPVEF